MCGRGLVGVAKRRDASARVLSGVVLRHPGMMRGDGGGGSRTAKCSGLKGNDESADFFLMK